MFVMKTTPLLRAILKFIYMYAGTYVWWNLSDRLNPYTFRISNVPFASSVLRHRRDLNWNKRRAKWRKKGRVTWVIRTLNEKFLRNFLISRAAPRREFSLHEISIPPFFPAIKSWGWSVAKARLLSIVHGKALAPERVSSFAIKISVTACVKRGRQTYLALHFSRSSYSLITSTQGNWG